MQRKFPPRSWVKLSALRTLISEPDYIYSISMKNRICTLCPIQNGTCPVSPPQNGTCTLCPTPKMTPAPQAPPPEWHLHPRPHPQDGTCTSCPTPRMAPSPLPPPGITTVHIPRHCSLYSSDTDFMDASKVSRQEYTQSE